MSSELVLVKPPFEVVRPKVVRRLPGEMAWGQPVQYEIKLDGYRGVGAVLGTRTVLLSRQSTDLAPGFPEVVEALEELPLGTVLDGEICAYVDGRMDFGALAHRRGRDRSAWPPVAFVVFDLLATTGEDWRPRPLEERWARLAELLADAGPPLQRVLATRSRDQALSWYDRLQPMGVEGIVAKGLRDRYGPRAHWVKVRHSETLDVPLLAAIGHPARPECVIVTMPNGQSVQTNKIPSAERAAVGRALAGRLTEPDAHGRRRVAGDVVVEVDAGTTRHSTVRFVRVRDDLA